MSEQKVIEKQGRNNINEFNRYLDNNTDILRQKFKQYLKQPLAMKSVVNSNEMESILKYIYDIFNFKKYQNNHTLNSTLRKSLVNNVTFFVNQQTISKQQIFDVSLAIQLLRYCIENNDMFAVHYDKKKAPKESVLDEMSEKPLIKQEEKEERQQKAHQQQSEPKEERKIEVQTPKKSQKGEASIEKKSIDSMNMSNEFELTQNSSKEEKKELIKKQLKGVFEFYCKQQQNLGPHFTFDNISHKCQTMNLGKFMAFATAANLVHSKQKIYSEGKLEKNLIVSIFKKLAEGQKQIGFSVFFAIMEELKKNDEQIYQKLGVGEEGSKGKNKLTQKLKYLSLPFSTRDGYEKEPSPFKKVFVPKLTGHSGKDEEALRQELISRKQRIKHDGVERMRFENKLQGSRNQDVQTGIQQQRKKAKFTLKLGQSNDMFEQSDLNFLSKLITQQDNDDIFLKDYRLPGGKAANKAVSHRNSYEQRSYNDEVSMRLEGEKNFGQKMGGLTSRPHNREDFILPSIAKRGGQTESSVQRHSIGGIRKGGPHILLS